jgi:hypothetical protein
VFEYSAERANALPCTAKSKSPQSPRSPPKLKKSKFSMSAADDQAEQLRLQPLEREKSTAIEGDSNFAKAKDSNTPFGWVPASRTFPSLDAIICTDKKKHYLPEKFQSAQTKPDAYSLRIALKKIQIQAAETASSGRRP